MLRLAIISSALARGCGLALQAIAIPLVYRSLGAHHYEFYVLLTAALATIAIGQMGAGPGLTQGIAQAHAAADHEREAALLNAALRLSGVAALAAGAIAMVLVHVVAPEKLFGSAFAQERDFIVTAADICILILVSQIVSGVVDSALAGYQEQVFSNLGAMLANVLSIGLLFLVCHYSPSVVGVVLVLYGVPTLARAANLAVLYARRPYLMHGLFRSCAGVYSAVLSVGMAFWAIEVGGLLEQHSGAYVLAHLSSTAATNSFAVVYKGLSLAGAVIGVLTQPLWPAFADAIAHRDIGWIHRAYARIRRVLTAYALLVALAMATIGPWLVSSLTHMDTSHDVGLFRVLALYFIANTWTHLLYITLMGMPGIWRVASIALAENLLMVVLGILLVPRWGAAGMALACLLASVLLPVWLLPRVFNRTIRAIATPA